jgi:hypothetical protein
MCHKNNSLLMAYMVNPVNNNFKCSTCGININDCIVRNNSYYCDTVCYQNKMHFSTPTPTPTPTSTPTTHSHPKVHFGGVSYASAPIITSTTVPSTTAVPSCPVGGTCASCGNTYKACCTALTQDGKWFCRKTCSSIYASSQRMAQFPAPAVLFPFASNMCTVFPLSVNPQSGKMFF